MRFVGVRDGRTVSVARLFDDGTVAPVAEVADFYLDPAASLAAAGALAGGSVARTSVVEVPAVPPAARVLCVGLNYRMHADEAGLRVPEHPAIFGRWTVSLIASGVTAPVPAGEPGWDWEVELAAVVGRPLKGVTPTEALAGVFGYAAFNDLSARTHQMHSRLWTAGKNADASGPISEIVTADETGNPGDGWRLTTVVNGETMQDGTTADMVFGVGELLAYLSEVMTLNPGDVVATGTPDGVGFKRTPPRYLVAGDVVEVTVAGVGSVTTPIV
jgi:2-keto-4-pentenoate hydratase/2-oxohepta-3-ene-1,7-dioic acid hydratase in catechol pathway